LGQDPLERVRQAVDALTAAELERYQAIADATAKTKNKAEVGRAAGISGSAVTQMLQRPAPKGPEMPFWGAGDGSLTIAVATKTEAPKDAAGPLGHVTATETIAAYECVRDLASQMGLAVNEREPIPPDGNVNLNRDGLVVICGPRLSPLVAQLLASDDVLRFIRDEHGWYLQDSHEKKQWRSPLDDGGGGDLGYLGRLPRPDGRGSFLYLGGIHAPGTAGVAHYLAGNLSELWPQVRTSRFSALIRCTLTPERRVESSERIAGPYMQ